MRFTIKLADVPISVETVYERCYDLCKDYLTDEDPKFSVSTTRSDIDAERIEDAASSSDEYLETLAVYRQIAERIIEEKVVLFHGSAIAVDGKGYLFTADSGTGKSTHTRIWREQLKKIGHDVLMINDDKPLLKFTDEAVLACGTPWNGKHKLGSNTMIPLAGICMLKRGAENTIVPVDSQGAFPFLMQYCYRPREKQHLTDTIVLLDELSRRIPMYELHCNMDPEAALISFGGMRHDG
ncbi:MAG: hypothetical protein II000_06195 [Clostridia bacterium]|nr:hypothetical protein [Clostridia bacterium]